MNFFEVVTPKVNFQAWQMPGAAGQRRQSDWLQPLGFG
jgi:hypothetical protein